METKTLTKKYQTLPEKSVIDKTSSALLLRGITTHYAENKFEALKLLKEIIPPSAEVMTGSSVTLQQIGFTDYLKSGEHPWKNIKTEIVSEKDKTKQNELRKQSTLSEYFLVSVHAVTEKGRSWWLQILEAKCLLLCLRATI
jgi:hypothetical protein